MTRLGQSSRVLLSTCVYLFTVVSVIGGALATTMALSSSEPAFATSKDEPPLTKIGPGYARMQPVDLGKPEKIVYSPPYQPHTSTPPASAVHRAPPVARIVVTPVNAAPVMIAPPMATAQAAQPRYTRPDIHQIY